MTVFGKKECMSECHGELLQVVMWFKAEDLGRGKGTEIRSGNANHEVFIRLDSSSA